MIVLAKLSFFSTVLMIHLLCSDCFSGILVGFGPHIGYVRICMVQFCILSLSSYWYDAFCIDCYCAYLLNLQIVMPYYFCCILFGLATDYRRCSYFCFPTLSWYVFEWVIQLLIANFLAHLLCVVLFERVFQFEIKSVLVDSVCYITISFVNLWLALFVLTFICFDLFLVLRLHMFNFWECQMT